MTLGQPQIDQKKSEECSFTFSGEEQRYLSKRGGVPQFQRKTMFREKDITAKSEWPRQTPTIQTPTIQTSTPFFFPCQTKGDARAASLPPPLPCDKVKRCLASLFGEVPIAFSSGETADEEDVVLAPQFSLFLQHLYRLFLHLISPSPCFTELPEFPSYAASFLLYARRRMRSSWSSS